MQSQSTFYPAYSTGYAGRNAEEFARMIHDRRAMVADVRITPYSKMWEWNGDNLCRLLGERHYRHVPEWGNVNKGTDQPMRLQNAPLGLVRVIRLLRKSPVILLCVCRNDAKCHRRLCADLLRGYAVPHLGVSGIVCEELVWPGEKPASDQGASHHCIMSNCAQEIPANRLMCRPHWKMVPQELQRAVWKHYRPGQEVDRNLSCDYMIAAKRAIEAVVEFEAQQLAAKGQTKVMYFCQDPAISKATIEAGMEEQRRRDAVRKQQTAMF